MITFASHEAISIQKKSFSESHLVTLRIFDVKSDNVSLFLLKSIMAQKFKYFNIHYPINGVIEINYIIFKYGIYQEA